MSDFDAIIIGSGPNGLVCALNLVRAGWHVLILERAQEIGGGMRTGEPARRGFRHDLYSSNLGRFSLSPLYQQLKTDFDALGIRFLTNDYPFASVFPNNKAVHGFKDQSRLEVELGRYSARDLAGWKDLQQFYQRVAPKFLPLFRMTMPSGPMVRQALQIMASPRDAARLFRVLTGTPRWLVESAFPSREVGGLVAPWSLHSDFGPDVKGGAIVPFFFAFNSQQQGLWVAQGGAGRVSQAMRQLIERQGGVVQAATEVRRIVVRKGTALGIETDDGTSYTASRAIIGNLSPRSMYGSLVSDDDIPSGFLRRIKRFRYGIGTFVIYLALSRPLQWKASETLSQFNTVHAGGAVDDLDAAYRQAQDGKIPNNPLLIVSQLSATDPTRAPNGQCVVRIHARPFPAVIEGDGLDEIPACSWDAAKDLITERLIAKLAEFAPSIRTDLLAYHSCSPLDLERDNPNWVGGDCGSGSNHLDQAYFLRPLPGWSRYRTPIEKLYMIGSSTWPGGGTHGMSGHLLAQELLQSG